MKSYPVVIQPTPNQCPDEQLTVTENFHTYNCLNNQNQQKMKELTFSQLKSSCS